MIHNIMAYDFRFLKLKRLRQLQLWSFFFFKIVLAIMGPLNFHMNVRISLSISAKNPVGIMMKIVLILQINFKSIAILTMLSLLTYEHGISFHSLISFNMS